MIYCLDTDILIEYFRGSDRIRERIQRLSEKDSISITGLCLYELFKGIFASGKTQEEALIKKLLETALVLEPSYESARIGGEIYASLKKKGLLINDADILIASIAKSHDATLVTNNLSHFSRIEKLKIENWLA